ncbi:hypothetical protein MRB53_037536 [Persea americana]|nr:hypothetical protein MRB53_037536 [Persea americana]
MPHKNLFETFREYNLEDERPANSKYKPPIYQWPIFDKDPPKPSTWTCVSVKRAKSAALPFACFEQHPLYIVPNDIKGIRRIAGTFLQKCGFIVPVLRYQQEYNQALSKAATIARSADLRLESNHHFVGYLRSNLPVLASYESIMEKWEYEPYGTTHCMASPYCNAAVDPGYVVGKESCVKIMKAFPRSVGIRVMVWNMIYIIYDRPRAQSRDFADPKIPSRLDDMWYDFKIVKIEPIRELAVGTDKWKKAQLRSMTREVSAVAVGADYWWDRDAERAKWSVIWRARTDIPDLLEVSEGVSRVALPRGRVCKAHLTPVYQSTTIRRSRSLLGGRKKEHALYIGGLMKILGDEEEIAPVDADDKRC